MNESLAVYVPRQLVDSFENTTSHNNTYAQILRFCFTCLIIFALILFPHWSYSTILMGVCCHFVVVVVVVVFFSRHSW